MDKEIRVWSIDQKHKPIETQHVQEVITALEMSPNGKKLVVGLMVGACVIYHCDNLGRLNYITRVDVRNRRGKFSNGRKVSGLTFMSKNDVLVTTSDSRLRVIDTEVSYDLPVNPPYRKDCRSTSTKAIKMRTSS
jgi:WD40 repeat protein